MFSRVFSLISTHSFFRFWPTAVSGQMRSSKANCCNIPYKCKVWTQMQKPGGRLGICKSERAESRTKLQNVKKLNFIHETKERLDITDDHKWVNQQKTTITGSVTKDEGKTGQFISTWLIREVKTSGK